MKLYDVLNPYKLLCESEMLEEALSTDFTIGFELEGVCTRERSSERELPSYHSNSEATGTVQELKEDLDDALGFGKGKIEKDGSLHPSAGKGGWTFEYGSPRIQFNPQNVNKIYKFLQKLPSLQVYTNPTCSFHTHMSYSGFDAGDAIWLTCCVALDDNLHKELSQLEVQDDDTNDVNIINFFHDRWAEDDMTRIKRYLINGDYEAVSNIVNSSSKYRMLRMHPQGTMEWRGPRDFLDNENINEIHGYILKLYKVVSTFAKIATLKEFTSSDGETTIVKSKIKSSIRQRGEFKSDEEKRLYNRTHGILDKIYNDANLMLKISMKQWRELLNSVNGIRTIKSMMTYGANRDVFYQLKPEVLNFLIDNCDLISIFVGEGLYRSYSKEFIDKLNEANGKKFAKEYFENAFKNYNESGWDIILDKSDDNIHNYIRQKFQNIFYDEITQNLKNMKDIHTMRHTNALYVMKKLKNMGEDIPIEWFRILLNSKEFYKLGNFEYLPVKIQKMMVKKNPYMVQYIQHLDPSILASLKTKYPNIEQYTIGEF